MVIYLRSLQRALSLHFPAFLFATLRDVGLESWLLASSPELLLLVYTAWWSGEEEFAFLVTSSSGIIGAIAVI